MSEFSAVTAESPQQPPLQRPAFWWASRLVAILGIVFSLVFFFVERRLEAERHTTVVKHFASDYAETIQERFALINERLISVRSFLGATKDVGDQQFSAFVKPLMESRLAFQTIEWIPRIQQAGGADTDTNTDTNTDTFPVRFMEPFIGDAPPVGLDLAIDPLRRAVMERARDSGLPLATAPVRTLRAGRMQVDVLVLLPVYVPGATLETAAERQSALLGFVAGVVRVEPLISMAIAGQTLSMFDLELIDPAAPAAQQLLVSYRADQADTRIDGTQAKPLVDTVSIPVTFGGLHWELLVSPMPALLKHEGGSISWLLLVFGLIVTLASVLITHLLLTGNRRVSALVTERTEALRTATEQMSFQRSLLASLIDTSPTGVLVVSPDRRWILWNMQFLAIWGISPEVLKLADSRSGIQSILPQLADPEKFMEIVDEIYDHPEIKQLDEVMLKDGRVYERHTAPVIADDGTVHGRSWFYHDITERAHFENDLRAARDTAEAASQAKSNFLATMSHEIRTPMNGVLGMADLLQMTELNAEQHEYLRIIKDSGSSLLTILNDILDFSKIEADKIVIEALPFAPAALLEEAAALMRGRVQEKQISLHVALHESRSLRVMGDPNRLRQVLNNLIGNAIKFTRQGRVDLRLQMAERGADMMHLHFEIADTGIGIPSEVLPQLFSPFFQADSSITRHFGGTGLGLAICKRLVEAMGGRIGVNSEEGKGSRFWFELILPLAPAEKCALVSSDTATEKTKKPSWAGRRVLVVDDNAINARVASEVLEKSGLTVIPAKNGQAAVDAHAADPVDLILMDVMMPVMNGHEATRQIRALEATQTVGGTAPPHVPIIAFTSNAFDEDRERALASGMDDFIAKPFREANFMAVMERWLPATSADDLSTSPVFDSGSLIDVTRAAGIAPLGLVDIFLDETESELHRLTMAMAEQRPESVAQLAHNIATTSLNVGAMRVADVARRLEQTTHASDDAARLVEQLRSELLHFRVAADRRRDEF